MNHFQEISPAERMVMLAKAGLSAQDVLEELARREGLSGIEEKASRPKD